MVHFIKHNDKCTHERRATSRIVNFNLCITFFTVTICSDYFFWGGPFRTVGRCICTLCTPPGYAPGGSDIVCEDNSGVTVRRNIQCAKKIQVQADPSSDVSGDSAVEGQTQEAENNSTAAPATVDTPEPTVRTSGRVRRPPARLNDYRVYR